jgi:chemotaxis protein CheD
MTGTLIRVGLGEIQVHQGPTQLTCVSVGACIAFAALDPTSGVGAMAHFTFPRAGCQEPIEKPGHYIDVGVPALIRAMEEVGADRSRLRVAYAGGATLLKFGPPEHEIGARNAAEMDASVASLGLSVRGRDVGGSCGRTVTLCTGSGEVLVRTVAAGDVVLCCLRAED